MYCVFSTEIHKQRCANPFETFQVGLQTDVTTEQISEAGEHL